MKTLRLIVAGFLVVMSQIGTAQIETLGSDPFTDSNGTMYNPIGGGGYLGSDGTLITSIGNGQYLSSNGTLYIPAGAYYIGSNGSMFGRVHTEPQNPDSGNQGANNSGGWNDPYYSGGQEPDDDDATGTNSSLRSCECGLYNGYCMIFRPGEKHAFEYYRSSQCLLRDCRVNFRRSVYGVCRGQVKAYGS